MNRPIILIGMAGSGKTAVGKALARLLRRPLIETDAQVEQTAAMDIAEIFAGSGEKRFRALEGKALADALSDGGPVISTGGGAILSADNRRRIRAGGWAVYLQATAELLQKRLANEAGKRPLLKGDDWAQKIVTLLQQREPLYQQTAHLVVVQNSRDKPAEVAQKVRAGLRHIIRS